MDKRSDLSRTPLLGEWVDHPLPARPEDMIRTLSPGSAELLRLTSAAVSSDVPSDGMFSERMPEGAAKAGLRGAAGTLPPGAPEWMQAARALTNELEQLIRRGDATELEQAAISRAWSAWALAGSTRRQIWRVAQLVSRAHSAIREAPRERFEQALHDCASVLHAGLPTPVRQNLPSSRVVEVVRLLALEADRWAAVVGATAELLGWVDYSRYHAATVIRLVIEAGEPPK